MSHNLKSLLMTTLMVFSSVLFLLLQSDCTPGERSQEMQNLRAFAKLYGYIRYFHPSDEAFQINWDKFVISGVEKVKTAADSQELGSILEAMFLPIAPTIQMEKR
jgi:hypothetical protein